MMTGQRAMIPGAQADTTQSAGFPNPQVSCAPTKTYEGAQDALIR